MNRNYLPLLILILFIAACNTRQSEIKNSKTSKNSIVLDKDSISKNNFKESHEEIKEEIYKTQEIKMDGYTFKFGYLSYDEDKFGFSNPGFLEVRKDGKLIFKDSFEGEGEVYVKSLGHHNLSGDKLVFTLNWGTEACDYTQYSNYYILTKKGKVSYLKEFYAGSGGDGYASRYYKPIFPSDSAGIPNSILLVEGLIFHEQDQPDLADTTYITFNSDKFKITKPTRNLDKVK